MDQKPVVGCFFAVPVCDDHPLSSLDFWRVCRKMVDTVSAVCLFFFSAEVLMPLVVPGEKLPSQFGQVHFCRFLCRLQPYPHDSLSPHPELTLWLPLPRFPGLSNFAGATWGQRLFYVIDPLVWGPVLVFLYCLWHYRAANGYAPIDGLSIW